MTKHDPWQSVAQTPRVKTPQTIKEGNTEAETGVPGFERLNAAIEVKGYGGISVVGTQDVGVIPARLLKLMITEQKNIESILTNYGIVVVQLTRDSVLDTPFYIQNKDGWTIAVPSVKNREQGMIQLIQALAAMDRALLEKHKLKVYKL